MSLQGMSKSARAKAIEASDKLVVRTVDPIRVYWVIPACMDEAQNLADQRLAQLVSAGLEGEIITISNAKTFAGSF